jgi:UrcA family protein
MTTPNAVRQVRMVTPRITIAMMICGVVGALGVGAASAAAGDDEVPAVTVKYDQAALSTDRGARQLYARLQRAASAVCVSNVSSGEFVSAAVLECRNQALARAVMKINNPRLVAVYQSSAKNG